MPRRHCCPSSSKPTSCRSTSGQSVGDPTKYTNTEPVGTGPMKLKSFSTPSSSTTSRIPTFWQADKVKVDELDYPVVNSNDTALLKMASHQADWTGIFNAALQTAFVQQRLRRTTTSTWCQSCRCRSCRTSRIRCWPTRQCARPSAPRSTATQMSTSGEAGLEQPASPTGLMPGQEKYLDAAVQREAARLLGAAEPDTG